MNCPECGNPNQPNATECEYCGASLQAGSAPRKTQLDRNAPPPDPAKRRTVFEPGPVVAPVGGPPVVPPRGLADDPFSSPPRSRPVYDPADPFRAAISPDHGSRPSPPAPPVPPAPAGQPVASKHATVLERPAAAQRRPAGVLTAFTGPEDNGTVYVLFEGRNTLGRDESQEVRLADGRVSSQHGFVFVRADGASFIDVSTNGTLVDGKIVHGQQVELTSGTVLRLGDTAVIFTRLAPVPTDLWTRP